MRTMFIFSKWRVAYLLILSASLLAAQESLPKKESNSRPLFGGLGISYPAGLNFQVGTLNSKDWGAAITFNWTVKPSQKEPSDFDGGKSFLGEGKDNVKPDNFYALGISGYRSFRGQQKFSTSLEAGLSLIRANRADRFIRVPNPCSVTIFGIYCSPNYTYERVNRFGGGGYLRGSIHYKVLDNFGLNLGIFSHINRVHSYLGADLMLTAGIFKYSRR